MKKSMIIKLALTTVLVIGCSQKAPDLDAGVDEGKNNITDSMDIVEDTVSIDENTYDSNKSSDSGSSNSSSDGFHSIYFDFGDYGIASSMENHINTNTNIVNSSESKIKIEGNCDEFGTDEYNYALGLKRAKIVKDSIVAQGVPEDKMVIISYGESNPVCTAPTDECYAENRRVDLHLVK